MSERMHARVHTHTHPSASVIVGGRREMVAEMKELGEKTPKKF